MMDAVLDLETLALSSRAAILSIGATCVDLRRLTMVSQFYCNVDLHMWASEFEFDKNTIDWWKSKNVDEDARRALDIDRIPIGQALLLFSDWCKDNAIDQVWGNGVIFDNAILLNAYSVLKLPRPWSYKGDMCYRTLKNIHKDVPYPPEEDNQIKHHAGWDARFEARHLLAIWEKHYSELV